MPRGSLRRRTLKSGEVVFDLVYDVPSPTGERRQVKQTFRGKKRDAEAELARRVAEAWGLGVASDRNVTVASYLSDWLETYKRRRKPASYSSKEVIVRRHIVPHLGHVKLAALRPAQVQRWVADLEDAGLSPTYVASILTTLRTALTRAVALELVPRNVAAAVEGPQRGPGVGRSWTAEEARRFLAHECPGDDYAMWIVTVNAQLRRGEIAGLRWEDVDFARALVHVNRQLIQQAGGGVRIDEPKTAKSRRVLPMAPAVMAVLAEHRRRQEARRAELEALGLWSGDDGWVFDDGSGRWLHPHAIGKRFGKACQRAGVPKIRLHDLRVVGITLMIESGVHEFIVRDRAGHADTETTRGYSHPGLAAQAAAAEVLADVLGLGGEDRVVEDRFTTDR